MALDPALVEARRSVTTALEALAAVEDTRLERPWPWRGEEADVRYGLYRQFEALEQAGAVARRMIARGNPAEPAARPMIAAATAARWDVHGLVAGMADDELDRDPGNGEWTLRQTLAHIVAGQRGYNWGSAWWLSRRDAPAEDFPKYIPEGVSTGMPDEEEEGKGTLADIRNRLDAVLDQGAMVFAGVDESQLAVRARWSGIAVDIGFRLGRWSSHIREHTVQLEKTLAMLGRPLSEVERVVRLIAGAYGRVEETLYMWPAEEPSVREATRAIREATAAIAEDAASVLRAARSASEAAT